MWAQRLVGPSRFEWIEVPQPGAADLKDGQVLVKLGAAAICGSDIPKFLGRTDRARTSSHGFPLHEVVGEVVAAKNADLKIGQRVVGYAEESSGLCEYFPTHQRFLIPLRSDVLDDVRATVIQPVATVLSALSALPAIRGKRAAVIGLGPLGVLFTQALKVAGAVKVTGVDLVDRSDVAATFGIDEVVAGSSAGWAAGLSEGDRPEILIEAVGHQQSTFTDAAEALGNGGHLVAFGIPDDEYYAIPFIRLFRKNATIYTGTTKEWRKFLAAAEEHVTAYRETFHAYVTHVFPFTAAEDAYNLYAKPAAGRLKVVMSAKNDG